MTKQEALNLIREYADIIRNDIDAMASDTETKCSPHAAEMIPRLMDAAGMPGRFPESGSKSKAMRWLGYMQGVLVCAGRFTRHECGEHSKRRSVAG